MNLHHCFKSMLVFGLLVFINSFSYAQKGLFVKISLGPGMSTEYSHVRNNGFALLTKNHAIGWGITDNFAIQVGEFGGLIKQKVDEFNYINIDPFGVGFCYKTPFNLKLSMMGAYGKVSLARQWTEATGKKVAQGAGINISVDKEWIFANHWAIRTGPQIYWFQAKSITPEGGAPYKFFTASLNVGVVYYLSVLG